MEQRRGKLSSIGDVIAERNIELTTQNPVVQHGFVQLPVFILKQADLSIGARLTYAMFLQYAWSNDYCFPGQDRLGRDIGMSTSRVNEFIKELEVSGLIEIKRRGQGRTNLYKINFKVQQRKKPGRAKS